MSRLIFVCTFAPFAVVVGELIHRQGAKIVSHAFGADSPVGSAVTMLLRVGYYLVTLGLLLWNVGIEGPRPVLPVDDWLEASLRFGVATFVLGFLHGFNVLAVSLFHRRNGVPLTVQ